MHRATMHRAAVALTLALVASGCVDHTFSAPNGPVSFEFACPGWTVSWAQADDPYVGVLVKGPSAASGPDGALADYLACSNFSDSRGVIKVVPTQAWAQVAIESDPDVQVLDAPPGDFIHAEIGQLVDAQREGVSNLPTDVAGGSLVVTVVEHPIDSST